MQFIIKAYDAKDDQALERRMAARPEHLANIQRVTETCTVLCAGGITNDAGKPIGSFLVMDFANREMLDAYLASEPYIRCNVWQDITVDTCNIVIMNNQMVGK